MATIEDVVRDALDGAPGAKPWQAWGNYSWDNAGLAPTKACCATSLLGCYAWLGALLKIYPDGHLSYQ
eukprot:13682562-Alexandrium_andersonii.AAC.1